MTELTVTGKQPC
uniref:Uncharacterized protein n=1 Tax=Arundo donax TaxID=35708 RepID=A0A0A8YWL9_ARUDO